MSDGMSDARREQNAYNKMRSILRDFVQCLKNEGIGDGYPETLSDSAIEDFYRDLKTVGLKLRVRGPADWEYERARAALRERERADVGTVELAARKEGET